MPCYSRIRNENEKVNYSEEKLSVIVLNQDSKKICQISGKNELSEFGIPFGVFPVDNAVTVSKIIEKAINYISIAEKYDVVIEICVVDTFEPPAITINYIEILENRIFVKIKKHPKFSENCVEISSITKRFYPKHIEETTSKKETSICLTKKEALELANALKTVSVKANNGDRVAAEIKRFDK